MEKIIDTMDEVTFSTVCGDFSLPGYLWKIINDVLDIFY